MSVLKVGDRSPDVAAVKSLLAAQGFWPASNTSPNFTPRLEEAIVYFQQTHLNQGGEPCGVDGKVGPETWWALRHPSGRAQRSFLSGDTIPAGIGDRRRKLLEIAIAEHGVRELPDGSNRSPRPRGGIDKYLPAWGKQDGKPGPPWCCFFVSWVTKEAFGRYPLGKREGACRNAAAYARELGLWRAKRDDPPVPGDAFVMLYRKDGELTGKGHIGFVHRVSPDGRLINTVEGNCGNRVKLGKRDLGDASIAGFIDFWQDRRQWRGFARGLSEATDVGGAGTR